MGHILGLAKLLFFKFSQVRAFPSRRSQLKSFVFDGQLSFQIIFPHRGGGGVSTLVRSDSYLDFGVYFPFGLKDQINFFA